MGTVQFGMDYGVSNRQGMTPPAVVKEILALAWQNGIFLLDTAAAYGGSEDVIGQCTPAEASFQIVTKTPLFQKARIGPAEATHLKEAFRQSLKRTKKTTMYGLLVHHAHDLLAPGGSCLWQAMEELRSEGLVQKIGASVYSPCEAEGLFEKYPLDLIQLPLNIFDQRMLQGGYLRSLKARGIEIHSRSAFLQGLLLMAPSEMSPYFDSIRPLLRKYRLEIEERQISPLAAALGFVHRQPDVDRIIVGVNHPAHLQEIIEAADLAGPLGSLDFSGFAVQDEAIINPSLWRLS